MLKTLQLVIINRVESIHACSRQYKKEQAAQKIEEEIKDLPNKMEIPLLTPPAAALSFFFLTFFFSSSFRSLHAQQTYINNQQDNCGSNASETLGYACNGPQTSCSAYLFFRSTPVYDSAITIAYHLGADSKMIEQFNSLTDVEKIPNNTHVIVPISCSCSGGFYQHNASYTLKSGESYYIASYDRYQGLTTCQAMINQNSQDARTLQVGMNLSVPLRCACPTQSQINSGFKYLLTYPIILYDDVAKIARLFQVDLQSLLDANEKSVSDDTIYASTPFLIPLKTEPTAVTNTTVAPPPPSTAAPPLEPPQASAVPAPADETGSDRKKWLFIGVGIGTGFCLLALAAVWVCFSRLPRSRPKDGKPAQEDNKLEETFIGIKDSSGTVSSQEIREAVGSLTVFKFEELQKATDFFSEDQIIKGCVYHGVIHGDAAAIKRMNGDVTSEIKILKQVRHFNLIRLSGFCLYRGNTYLVYELAENGSLSDWLHGKKNQTAASTLSWKQRVQIAHDIANGLNYLHNCINPPYIHKDLKSSNILLDGNFRAKVANFSLARPLSNQVGLQMTRHVVGTQGYMAPEYLEHGLVTPKLDVYAFGVLLLELLSGREAIANTANAETGGELLLSASIKPILDGEEAGGKLQAFIDPCLQHEYPLDLAFAIAELAMNCVEHDLNSRPTMDEVVVLLSKILSSSLYWDSASADSNSGSLVIGW